MAAAEDLKRLAQEISNARQDRRLFKAEIGRNVSEIRKQTAALKQDSAELLRSIAGQHEDMAQALRRKLDDANAARHKAGMERRKEAAGEAMVRRSLLAELTQNVQTILDQSDQIRQQFRTEQNEMKKTLSADLNRFVSDLSACTKKILKTSENNRKTSAEQEKSHRRAEIKAVKSDVNQIRQDVQNFLNRINTAQNQVGDELSSALQAFVTNLKTYEKQRKSDVHDFLGSIRAEIRAMGEAWQGLFISLDSEKNKTAGTDKENTGDVEEESDPEPANVFETDPGVGSNPEAEPDANPDTAASTGTKPQEESEPGCAGEAYQGSFISLDSERSKTAGADKEYTGDIAEEPEPANAFETEPGSTGDADHHQDSKGLKDQITNMMKVYSDGIKMTQLAELLNIDQWRLLIPVIREMLDDELIRKEDAFYFPA